MYRRRFRQTVMNLGRDHYDNLYKLNQDCSCRCESSSRSFDSMFFPHMDEYTQDENTNTTGIDEYCRFGKGTRTIMTGVA